MASSASAAKRSRSRSLSLSSLNKLQARALRAKIMHAPNADALQREYEEASEHARREGPSSSKKVVEVLPRVDARGKLYDFGSGKVDDERHRSSGSKRRKVTTDYAAQEAEDDSLSVNQLLRREKLRGRTAGDGDPDAGFAQAIMKDSKFENDLEYMDDNSDKLGRRKMRSDAIKRQFALHDYKRTQKVMAECPFCLNEDSAPPGLPMIALGGRVYLSCTLHEELVEGHCLIVPIQHYLNMLEGDDDVWDEVQNFMKCLIRMFAEEDKGVIFYETVLNLKWQQHTVIECVPLPWAMYDEIPAYFKEAILQSESEWSQHKKLIDFSSRPGGFRRAMVPNLPYFMVQFDHKGEKGYGHVIEGGSGDHDDDELGQSAKGNEFPRYFAGEIVGNLLHLEPRRWRHPKRLDSRNCHGRLEKFKARYDKFDWTKMLQQ